MISSLRSVALVLGLASAGFAAEQIHVAFLWHMHQPIYYPYESPIVVDQNGRFSFSVVDVHNQRFGPYTAWPGDAIRSGQHLPHLGAHVSFSGSLMQNLNALEAGGVNGGMWNGWRSAYNGVRGLRTTLGHHRLDLVSFGFHHPLMALLDEQDLRMQIRLHQWIAGQTWSGDDPVGMFPPETAFSTRMIPSLVAEGVSWVMVDNIHFDRACAGYPYTPASNLIPPNPADQINPDPAAQGGAWLQLQNLWAPSRVSVPFGYQPHYAQYVDAETGDVSRIIVVPAARYEGHEDGRGGYGAFLYDRVMDQYLPYNTDPAHPMLVLLHHDGDNFGGGSESYYHHNFDNMVSWVSQDPDYDVTVIDDYLERFPPDPDDVIHVENGSWVGADSGDAEFKKWLADPDGTGFSPDRNSWAVLTAAKNRVFTAERIDPVGNVGDIIDGGADTARAWRWLLVSQASDYWYWDGTEIWDSNVTRGCNEAVRYADRVIDAGRDRTPPTIFHPQREPYNPGGTEWPGQIMASDFEVWTYVHDVSGLSEVTLRWRLDLDGVNPLESIQNETYAGGGEVGGWQSIVMTESDMDPPQGILQPTYRAHRYAAMVEGQQNVLIDYYVEAVDTRGYVQRSDIQHVFVGDGDGSGGQRVTIDPDPARAGEDVTIEYDPAGGPLDGAASVWLHYGFNDWDRVIDPDPRMSRDDDVWRVTVPVPSDAMQLDLVFNDGQGTWDNNGGADWHFSVGGGGSGEDWVMDGVRDARAFNIVSNNGMTLWAGLDGDVLYVATDDAGEGNDHFVYLAIIPGNMRDANWAKSGRIANWSAYLADENDNDYEAWYDATGDTDQATGSNGGVLEGTIDLRGEFGAVPDAIYLAVGVYQTQDGGLLNSDLQLPPTGDDDGDIDANEYIRVVLDDIRSGGRPGDFDRDGDVDRDDYDAFVSCYTGRNGGPVDSACRPGDFDRDDDVDCRDFRQFKRAWTAQGRSPIFRTCDRQTVGPE